MLEFRIRSDGYEVIAFGKNIGHISKEHGFFISAGVTTREFTLITPQMLLKIREKSIEVTGQDF